MDMLTHELKTPIAVMSLTLGNLSGQALQKRRAEQALSDMNGIVERCQQLDQLEHQRLTSQPHRCQMDQILAEMRSGSTEPDRLVITASALPDLDSDPQLLRLILGNLFSNALKYALPETVIPIHAEAFTFEARPGIRISVQNVPGTAGLPDPEKVFSKYYRSPNAQRQTGSGLGLYLVRSFTGLLGGNIRYEVTQGQARFVLWIPC